jgi:hypothetical protein
MEILLGLTGSEEGRKHFKDTDTCKRLLRVILEEPENQQQEKESVIALQILINLTQELEFIE